MFDFFKGKPKAKPKFSILETYENRDKYFYRIAEWFWHNKNEITVVDPNKPRVITLDPWPQLVYLAADGQRTVSQYIDVMANKYSGQIPEELDETIIKQINVLLLEKIIKISDTPQKLDTNILHPNK